MANQITYFNNGQVMDNRPQKNGKDHGICRGWDANGGLIYTTYYVYGKYVTEKAWHEHELIEKLAGI